jgi:hypothetical protein
MNFKFQLPSTFVCLVFHKNCLIKIVYPIRSIRIQNFTSPRWLLQVLLPPRKFDRLQFLNNSSYGIENYGVEITFNGMTSLLTSKEIYLLVQKLLGENTDRQHGDFISLAFLLKESRLIYIYISECVCVCMFKINSLTLNRFQPNLV